MISEYLLENDIGVRCVNNFLKVSDNAMKKISSLLFENSKCIAFRIFTESGGCAGINYKVSIVDEFFKAQDSITHIIEFVYKGILFRKFIIVQKKSLLSLLNSLIDFNVSDTGGGFSFDNPNATSTCGCGLSFLV